MPNFLNRWPWLLQVVAAGATRHAAIRVLLFNLALALVAGGVLFQVRSDENAAAGELAANTARLVEIEIEHSLMEVDIALQAIVTMHPLQRAPEAQAQLAAAARTSLRSRLPALDELLTTDAAGNALDWPPAPADAALNLADREYFARLRDDPAAGLLMTGPAALRTNGVRVIVLARRLVDAQGRFDGVAAASIPVHHFADAFNKTARRASDTLTLRHANGELIARVPEPLPGAAESVPAPRAAPGLVRAERRNDEYGLLLEVALSPREHLSAATMGLLAIGLGWLGAALGNLAWTVRTVKHARRQERHEQALRASERRASQALQVMQQFAEQIPAAAYLKDEQLRIVLANAGFKSTLGVDAAEVIGKTNEEVFGAEVGAALSADDRRVLESGRSETIEAYRGDRCYAAHKFRIQGSDGRAMLGGLTFDVTVQHRADERRRVLLELSTLSGQLAERDFLSRGLEAVEHLTRSRIGFLHLVSDDQETTEPVAWTAGARQVCTATSERHYPIAQAGIWADAVRRREPVVVNDYPAHDARRELPEGHAPLRRLISVPVIEGERVRLLIGVGNRDTDYGDIDVATLQLIGGDLWRNLSRRRAEAALEKRVAELDALNARLVATQLQLLQSEKLASIGQLAAGVAHELNNPIGFVHSNLGTLAEYVKDLLYLIDLSAQCTQRCTDPLLLQKLAQARRECDFDFVSRDIVQLLDESREGAERVRVIVQNLRDFAHVTEEDWVWSDLRCGLDSTLNIVWHELKYKAEISKQYGEIPAIRCMPGQLNQVFMILLVNAGQAIESRGQITIRTGVAGDRVWVEIEDSGCGIAPENLGRIYDPFFTTKPVGKGTGLGLSLAYSIVAKHQGQLTVRSEVGVGTCFRLTLPLERGDAAEPLESRRLELS